MTCLRGPVPPLKPVKQAEQLVTESQMLADMAKARRRINEHFDLHRRKHAARQRIIDKLLADVHRRD